MPSLPIGVSVTVTLLLSLLSAAPGESQSVPAGQLAFEVASVRRVDNSKLGDSISMNIGTIRGEEVTFGNATLTDCIRFAYGVSSDVQIVGPGWLKSKEFLYDITAKSAPGASREQLQAMMRALLAERFRLVIHSEPRELSYLALVPARAGSRLVRMERPDGFQGTTWGGRIDSILTMPALANLLSRFDTARPTIDSTGLTGSYKVKLIWATSGRIQNAENVSGPPLPTALEEQLGLKLEPRKGPLPVFVVDSADQNPSLN